MLSKDKNTYVLNRLDYLLWENISDPIAVLLPYNDYIFELVNDCWHQSILGYYREDLLNKSFLDYVYSDDVKKVGKILKKASDNIDSGTEIRLRAKDGNYSWFEIKVKRFMDNNNHPKLLCIFKDLAKQKELEDQIQQNENSYKQLVAAIPEIKFWKLFTPKKTEVALKNSFEMLQLVMENIPQYVFWKDKNLTYLGSNDNYSGLVNLKFTESIIGRNDKDLLWNNVHIKTLQEKEQNVISLNEAELHSLESWIDKNGKEIFMDVNRVPFRDSKGKVVGILVTYDNVTESLKTEGKLKDSEEKYRDLLETSAIGILEFDLRSNQIIYINPHLLDVIGYTLDELILTNDINKFIYPEDRDDLFIPNDEKEFEFRIITKEGKIKWLSGQRIINYDKEGELVSLRLWLEDITDKKMYESLIYELNINFLNYTTDIQNNIEMLIETCAKLLSADIVLYCRKTNQKGKLKYQLISSDKKIKFYDSGEFKENLFVSKFFNENHDYVQTFYSINNSKYSQTDEYIMSYKAVGCIGKLIMSQDEYNSAICVFYKDQPTIAQRIKIVLFLISAAIEIEERRWQIQQDLEEQNKFKTDLITRISHELKTPLISVKGFTELLLTVHSSKMDSEMLSIVHEIEEGGNRLENLIIALLNSSNLDQGKMKLNFKRGDFSFLIRFCVKELKGVAKLRDQKINIEIQDELIASFDKERIFEVLSNLLLNAIKYTPPGGVITIKTETISDEDEKFYIVSMQDTGIGFTEQEKGLIFKQFGKIERFGQGYDIITEGSGIGLYISKKIIELHGGKIWLESEGRNKGSTFHFSLPTKIE